jgi:hypothetical protein
MITCHGTEEDGLFVGIALARQFQHQLGRGVIRETLGQGRLGKQTHRLVELPGLSCTRDHLREQTCSNVRIGLGQERYDFFLVNANQLAQGG